MRENKMARVLATIFLGMLFGVYLHFRELRWLSHGRDAFLSDQGHRFDLIMKTHSAVTTLAAGVILAVVAAVVYETISRGFAKFIPAVDVEE